jgi:hypothetical protein
MQNEQKFFLKVTKSTVLQQRLFSGKPDTRLSEMEVGITAFTLLNLINEILLIISVNWAMLGLFRPLE